LRKEHRLRVFQNRALRKIFRSERDEVAGEWRRHIMRSFMMCTPVHEIISRRMRWVGHSVCSGGRRGTYRVLCGEM
jgi:hypothetical protein